jgi:ribonuclease H2 subunit B
LQIADQKGPADLKAYIFNEEKFLFWLSRKTTNLIDTIKKNNLKVKQTATSELFNKTELHSTDEAGEQEYIKSAHAIISDYISLEHSKQMENILGINTNGAQNKKRKYMDSNVQDESTGNSKKVKPNDLVESAKEKKVSAKEKAMEKAAKGTKSISSFFGAKPKK